MRGTILGVPIIRILTVWGHSIPRNRNPKPVVQERTAQLLERQRQMEQVAQAGSFGVQGKGFRLLGFRVMGLGLRNLK